ncbi:hypothetical protein BJV82DRAFT_618911 [Fennellomyces sp. T-0311]|nr:hypothetical protein BJV82DRAFT_618911 [Fennellomyces sp. T-0311]
MASLRRKYRNVVSTISSHISTTYSTIPYTSSSHRANEKPKTQQQPEEKLINGSQTRNIFEILFPYDIICLILHHLRFNDLLQCARVCQTWCEFVLDLPEFWRRLSLEIPRPLDRHTMEAIIRRHVLSLDGSLSIRAIHDTMVFFASPCTRLSIRVLQLQGLTLKNRHDAHLLAHALQHANTVIERVEFIDCVIYQEYMIYPILTSCTKFSHVSFSQDIDKVVGFRGATISLLTDEDIIVPHVKFSSLTYLKLAGGRVYTDEFAGIFRRCPCLEDLLLDSDGTMDQGNCIRQAIKYCPRLKNLVVNKGAVIPPCMDGTCRPAHKIGLSRLVLAGGYLKYEPHYTTKIFKKFHHSLELVYLQYVRGGGTVSAAGLRCLARNGAPRLRALWLSNENISRPFEAKYEPLDVALVALLSTCPALEQLHLHESHTDRSASGVYINDAMLRTIAKNCPKLHHLGSHGYPGEHSNDGLLRFAAETKANITFLEINIEYPFILPLVKTLTSLRYLKVCNLFEPPASGEPFADSIQMAKYILIKRNGSLVFMHTGKIYHSLNDR